MHFEREEVEAARQTVHAVMPPTPQYAWPLLRERLGMTVWVKHENHTPVGAFKVRGGLTYFATLAREQPALRGVITATRGNHGQSVALAARRHGLAATIVVPHANSLEKNAAMRALGATLIEHGDDFQAAREHAMTLAVSEKLHMVPSIHRDLVVGVMSYWVEFFESFPRGEEPEVVFVPIGLGSGFCAAAAARRRAPTPARGRRWWGWCLRTPPAISIPSGPAGFCRRPTQRYWPTGWLAASPTTKRCRSCCAMLRTSSPSPTTKSPRPCACCSPIRTTSPRAPGQRRLRQRCSSGIAGRPGLSASR